MKNLRKILCCVLSVLMMSGMLLTAPATANAVETNIQEVGATYSGTTGSCTWNLNTTTGVLSISGTGAMGDYSWPTDSPWDSYSSYVKTVSIANGVTSIGDKAFYHCASLTSVTIPSSVTSIGSDAFYKCTSLTSVTIPSSVTSIGNSAFSYCTSLTSISVNSNNTKYSSINGNLYNKDKTTLIQYAIGKTATSFTIPSSVTSIGYDAFEYCKSLASVTIPSSVTSIGSYAFYNCTSLTSVTIPSSVTSIGDYAFYDCTSLTSVTIPSSVTSIGNSAFSYCTSLTSITIPSSVTSIGSDAFYNCTSLASVTIPSSVTSIGSDAFYKCTSLTSVTIPSSVTSIGYDTFKYCTSLTSISVNSNNTKYSSINGNLYNKDQTTLIQYAIGKTATSFTIPSSVTSIGDYAFYYCTSLASVTIPSSVTSIGSDAFYYCTSLTSVTIPSSVTSIGDYAFSNCSKLKTVYYTGTASEWSNISIGTNNTPLTNATIYYSVEETEASETEPTAPSVCRHNSTWTRGKKSATYFTKGYTGDKVCNSCGKVVSKGRSVAKKILATPKAKIKLRGNAIVVSYTKVKNAQGFVINCKFGSQEYTKTVKTTKSKTITLSNIKRGIKAKIKVRAYTTSDKRKAYSDWTKAKTLKIK